MNLAPRASILTAFALLTCSCSRSGNRAENRAEPPLPAAVLPAAAPPASKPAPASPGQTTKDWHVCARQGAQLRVPCRPNDEACAQDADGKIVECYRAVYAQLADSTDDHLELLGPRFAYNERNSVREKDGSISYLQEGDAKYLSPRRFAEEECKKALADVPQKPCIEELIFGVDRLVWMGGFGAGP